MMESPAIILRHLFKHRHCGYALARAPGGVSQIVLLHNANLRGMILRHLLWSTSDMAPRLVLLNDFNFDFRNHPRRDQLHYVYPSHTPTCLHGIQPSNQRPNQTSHHPSTQSNLPRHPHHQPPQHRILPLKYQQATTRPPKIHPLLLTTIPSTLSQSLPSSTTTSPHRRRNGTSYPRLRFLRRRRQAPRHPDEEKFPRYGFREKQSELAARRV